jgi:2-keto-4-pentenoate hydratase/2-oxohepta-3-ene-1,7-dioic acid hydratase in catechol pathway
VHLITYAKNGSSAAGLLKEDGILPLSDLGFSDALSFIAAGEPAIVEAERISGKMSVKALLPLSCVKLLAPLPRPPKILCVGLNYRDHAREAKMEIPAVPTVFAKFPTAVVGPEHRS